MFNKIRKKLKCIPVLKIAGALILTTGAVLLVCFLPGWAWGAITGLLLVICGCYMLTI